MAKKKFISLKVVCNCRDKENCDIWNCPFINQPDGIGTNGSCNLSEDKIRLEYGEKIIITKVLNRGKDK
jgi:hypothetical protein